MGGDARTIRYYHARAPPFVPSLRFPPFLLRGKKKGRERKEEGERMDVVT